jgi:hypothetical protein
MKFFNFLPGFQSNPAKQLGYLGSQALPMVAVFFCRVAEDFPDFFFHASAVALGTALQAGFYFVFQIADKDLRHGSPAIMIALQFLASQ